MLVYDIALILDVHSESKRGFGIGIRDLEFGENSKLRLYIDSKGMECIQYI